MRLPANDTATIGMRVDLHCDDERLHWNRTFDGNATMKSTFVPVGRHPTGHWVEHVGALRVELGVAIVDGGWHWQPRRASLAGLPLPRWLTPRITARKQIVDGRYRFLVATALPGLGTLVSYQGDLVLTPGRTGASPAP